MHVTVLTVFLLIFSTSLGFVSASSEDVDNFRSLEKNLVYSPLFSDRFFGDFVRDRYRGEGRNVSCRAWRSTGIDRHFFGHSSCRSCLRKHSKCKEVCEEEERIWECAYQGTDSSYDDGHIVTARGKKRWRAQNKAENRCYDRYFECRFQYCHSYTNTITNTYSCRKENTGNRRGQRRDRDRRNRDDDRRDRDGRRPGDQGR